MIQPLGSNNGLGADAEYKRIMQEMYFLNLYPSGNKNLDARKLANVKSELVQKIQNSFSGSENNSGVQVISPVDETDYIQRSEMEEQRLGAMNIANLNKFYFGL